MTRTIFGGLAIAVSLAVPIVLFIAGLQKVPADPAAKNTRVPARALPTQAVSR